MENTKTITCPFTGSTEFKQIFVYDEPPELETHFEFNTKGQYHREVWQCTQSKHFLSVHDMDMTHLYSEEYVTANYKDRETLAKTFEKIINLDPDKSDNTGRVKRINKFADSHFDSRKGKKVLDVGSGLGVFSLCNEAGGVGCDGFRSRSTCY